MEDRATTSDASIWRIPATETPSMSFAVSVVTAESLASADRGYEGATVPQGLGPRDSFRSHLAKLAAHEVDETDPIWPQLKLPEVCQDHYDDLRRKSFALKEWDQRLHPAYSEDGRGRGSRVMKLVSEFYLSYMRLWLSALQFHQARTVDRTHVKIIRRLEAACSCTMVKIQSLSRPDAYQSRPYTCKCKLRSSHQSPWRTEDSSNPALQMHYLVAELKTACATTVTESSWRPYSLQAAE